MIGRARMVWDPERGNSESVRRPGFVPHLSQAMKEHPASIQLGSEIEASNQCGRRPGHTKVFDQDGHIALLAMLDLRCRQDASRMEQRTILPSIAAADAADIH